MDILEEKWKRLQLIEEEHKEMIIDDRKVFEKNTKGLYSLVGKIHVERNINKEVPRSTLVKLWKTTKLFTIFEISSNVLIIKFECQDDKMRVMQGRL